uniref:Uncharacterized protein n=1 Tax=Timema tahoe TaxID=61484 RepID=A0A7R9NWX7_9NEOP|nr:unnamed protein product [Timema tahoe]
MAARDSVTVWTEPLDTGRYPDFLIGWHSHMIKDRNCVDTVFITKDHKGLDYTDAELVGPPPSIGVWAHQTPPEIIGWLRPCVHPPILNIHRLEKIFRAWMTFKTVRVASDRQALAIVIIEPLLVSSVYAEGHEAACDSTSFSWNEEMNVEQASQRPTCSVGTSRRVFVSRSLGSRRHNSAASDQTVIVLWCTGLGSSRQLSSDQTVIVVWCTGLGSSRHNSPVIRQSGFESALFMVTRHSSDQTVTRVVYGPKIESYPRQLFHSVPAYKGRLSELVGAHCNHIPAVWWLVSDSSSEERVVVVELLTYKNHVMAMANLPDWNMEIPLVAVYPHLRVERVENHTHYIHFGRNCAPEGLISYQNLTKTVLYSGILIRNKALQSGLLNKTRV